ncbi:MAG: glycine betaine ABC transporter substrate-binding protein [Verrucomicrobiales bacterium]
MARLPELRTTLLEHLFVLTLLPVGVAVLIAIPLAVSVRNIPVLRSAAIAITGIVQTIPSLAMLAFLLPLFGIGKVPAVIALTLYAILPILQNTLAGLRDLPPDVLEAADGMGFSKWQRLFLVELSFALPIIVSGIRTATVICVGVATLSTFIGAGGLGDFINRGLSLNRMSLLLIGAGAAAALALMLDFILDTAGLALRAGRRPRGLFGRFAICGLLLASVVAFAFVPIERKGGAIPGPGTGGPAPGTVRIGSKNFTEQIVLGELLAQWIEAKTDLRTERRFNLGGTMICHEALTAGAIDLYVEYSGTALLTLLGRELDPGASPEDVLEEIRAAYRQRFDLEVLPPLGFENTYAVTIRSDMAKERGWTKISDLVDHASELRAGFTAEFMEREDGLRGLVRVYGLDFGSLGDLAPELMYPAVAQGSVDVIGAFSTDGRILEFDLVTLEDDRKFFPPYEAAPVARRELLDRHPELEPALRELGGLLDGDAMRGLNHAVDVDKRNPRQVVRDFLESRLDKELL